MLLGFKYDVCCNYYVSKEYDGGFLPALLSFSLFSRFFCVNVGIKYQALPVVYISLVKAVTSRVPEIFLEYVNDQNLRDALINLISTCAAVYGMLMTTMLLFNLVVSVSTHLIVFINCICLKRNFTREVSDVSFNLTSSSLITPF